MSARKFDTNTARTPSFFDSTTYLYGWKTSEPTTSQDFKVLWDDVVDEIKGGFTSGSVIYADSSGVLAEDNAGLFYDDINQRLGVGITSPDRPIHVLGGFEFTDSAGTTNHLLSRAGSYGGSTLSDPDVLWGETNARVLMRFGQQSWIYSNHTGVNVGFGFVAQNGQFYFNNNSIGGGSASIIFGTGGGEQGVITSVFDINSPTSWGVNINLRGNDNNDSFKVNYSGTTLFEIKRNATALGNFTNGIELQNNAITLAAADTIRLYSNDLSAGNTMLGLRTEGTPIGTGTPTQDTTIALEVNGTVYYVLASTSAT